ncbi:MAG: MFS transporter [Desulfobacteraceae bacterium]
MDTFRQPPGGCLGQCERETMHRAKGFFNIYYGWIIVALGLISMAFWFGIRSSFSVFYVALLEDFPWSRGESAGVQSMALLTYTFLAPLVGGLIDRFGPRRVIIPGILILTLGLALCATIKTLGQFYFLYGVLVGAGVTCIGIVSYSAILAHWFEKKRGLASGIAVSGMGLGTFFLVPVSQHLISLWGWRITFMLLAGLVLTILLPLNALFLKHKPEELGLHPDGLKVTDPPRNQPLHASAAHSPHSDRTLKEIVRTGSFWALNIFPFLSVIGVYIILVHNVKFLVDKGIDGMAAAFIFALAGVVSSFFRIFWGWLSDRIGREKTYALGMASISMGVLSLLLLDATGEKAFAYAFFIFFGTGWGVTAPMFMAAAADLFKGRVFGLIYGILEGGIGVGAAFGAWVAGYIFDTTKSYGWAFVLAVAVFILSALFMWLAAPRKARMKSLNDT